MSLGRTLERMERELLEGLLEKHRGNVAAIARALDVTDDWVRSRLRTHGLRAARPERTPAQTPRPQRPRAKQFRRMGKRTWETV